MLNRTLYIPIFALLVTMIFVSTVSGSQVEMNLALARPVFIPEAKSMNYVKIGLTGIPMDRAKDRAPVNLVIVLDKSGSMQGSKLAHAKEAAIMAIERLNSDDIISVVAYDSLVSVLVPATKVSDKTSIISAINRLQAGSNTALFAGVSKGASEVRKFLDHKRVNRIILLSDGLANEGPSSPEELGELGASLRKEGITVTTFGLGLGYNEDLMAALAGRSDGNHAFIEKPEELSRVFDLEFGDVLSVVAQRVRVEIECMDFRPVRLLGREGEIRGRHVFIDMNQLYGKQEKFILLEVENPLEKTAEPNVQVSVSYTSMQTNGEEKITSGVYGRISDDPADIESSEDREVMVSVINLLANENYKVATRLRDEGKIEEAKKNLEGNRGFLLENYRKYESQQLKDMAERMEQDSKTIDDENEWSRLRKGMRKLQHESDFQQSY